MPFKELENEKSYSAQAQDRFDAENEAWDAMIEGLGGGPRRYPPKCNAKTLEAALERMALASPELRWHDRAEDLEEAV